MKGTGTQVFIGAAKLGKLTATPAMASANVTNIETTTHDDTVKTYVAGLRDSGELTLTGQVAPADLGQVSWLATEGDSIPVCVLLSDGTPFFFSAVLGKMFISAPLDGLQAFTASAKITGEIAGIAPATAVAATLSIGSSNAEITYTARFKGEPGNHIIITQTIPAGLNTVVFSVTGLSITIAAGAAYIKTITGTLTTEGETPVSFPELSPCENTANEKRWSDTGDWDACTYRLSEGSVTKTLSAFVGEGASWEYDGTWSPVSPATGTPTITDHPPTSQKLASLCNAAGLAITALHGGDGTGSVIASDASTMNSGHN